MAGSDHYQEYVGYRTNAKSGVSRQKGCLTVYAERRNNDAVLGEYGGDAYPIVFEQETEQKGMRSGIIIVADGVGNAAYPHPTLEGILAQLANLKQAKIDGTVAKDENDVRAMLSVFLRTLFGAEIFDESNSDVLEYALRSFSDVPADGFFAADKSVWAGNVQKVMPFYKRDSQSLGSRITCVGLYKKFRHYIKNLPNMVLTKETVSTLRSEIENFLTGELRNNVLKLFRHEDAPDTVKRNRYFLGSTVAMWFYLFDESTNKISAVAFNCGDARCYVVNEADGVRQISVDDALPNGNMSAFVNYGLSPENHDEFHDLHFRARIVEVKAPCILFACSDGVYDTCPGARKTDQSKISLEYGESTDPCDLLFEVNMLAALRRTHSFEDFAREIAFNFYAQGHAKCAEVAEGIFRAKRDDSSTLGARFFGANNGLEILEKLRQTSNTSLDKIFAFMQTQNTRTPRVPYAPPHVETSEAQDEQRRIDFATGDFKMAVVDTLVNNFKACFAKMKENGTNVMWGVPDCNSVPPFLKMFFNQGKMISILNCAIQDLKACGSLDNIPADWLAYEHVLAVPELAQKLKAIDFAAIVESLETRTVDTTAESALALYDWFEHCFFGAPLPEHHEVVESTQCLRPSFDAMLGLLENIYEEYSPTHDVESAEATESAPQSEENGAVDAEEQPQSVDTVETTEKAVPVIELVEETVPVIELVEETAPVEASPIEEAKVEPIVEVSTSVAEMPEPHAEPISVEAPIVEKLIPNENDIVLWEEHRGKYTFLLPKGATVARCEIKRSAITMKGYYLKLQGGAFKKATIEELVRAGQAKEI